MAKKPLAQRVAHDPKLLARALATPGLRSKLPAKYLTRAQRQQRTMNTRLAAPITAGSSITERDLAHQADAATNVQYGPQEAALRQQLGVAQTRQRDTGGFYDQYIAQLAANRKAISDQQQATQAQLGQISAGITGLAGTEGAALQQQANQRAAGQGVAQAGDLSSMASNAAATRQALVGSYQAQQAQQGAAANQYAGTLANVVGPGQKLGALAQAQGRVGDIRQKQTDLAGLRGAYNQKYRGEQRQAEAKLVLARQTLAGNIAQDTTTAAITAAKLAEQQRANRAREKTARDRIKATTQKAIDDATKTGSQTILSGAFAGKSQSWLSTATDAQKQKLIDAYDTKHGGGAGAGGKGPTWLPQGQAGTGLAQLGNLKDFAAKAKAGVPFIQGHQRERPRDRYAAQTKITQNVAAPKHPMLLRAALDAVYDGHISAFTVKGLIQAGYKPTEVARTLGVPTSGEYKKAHPGGGRRPDTAGNPNVSR
jgi:hypothetical protein